MTGAVLAESVESSWPRGLSTGLPHLQKHRRRSSAADSAGPFACVARSHSQTDDLSFERLQLDKLRVGLEPTEYFTCYERSSTEAGDKWSLTSNCYQKDQTMFPFLRGEECPIESSMSKQLKLSAPDEPLAPVSPRFSCQWDKVNREAYFNDLSSLDSSDISPRYAHKLVENVVFELENAPDNDKISVKLSVVHSFVQQNKCEDQTPKKRDLQKGFLNRFFRSMFPWCLNPQVEMEGDGACSSSCS